MLDPLRVAAVHLGCRALRSYGTQHRQRVTVQFDGCYSATAIASREVLQSLHTRQSQLNRLDGAGVANSTAVCQKRRHLHAQLLLDISHEVVSLSLWCAPQSANGETKEVVLKDPQSLVARMTKLESLKLHTWPDSAVIRRLTTLRRLQSLSLPTTPVDEEQLKIICCGLSLTELDLGKNGGTVGDFDQTTKVLSLLTQFTKWEAGGGKQRQSGLSLQGQKLQLTLSLDRLNFDDDKVHEEQRQLSVLNTLTSLTALHVRMWRPADLSGLACLTGLKSLRGEFLRKPEKPDEEPDDPYEEITATLAPLAVLTGLTLLDFMDDVYDYSRSPPDVSVLSSLTALCVLRCCLFDIAETVNGDPIPVQLRFLCSATALEELELGFETCFWFLSDDSTRALPTKVAALPNLKRIKIVRSPHYREEQDEEERYYEPLTVFAASASIETLSYMADSRLGWRLTLEDTAIARACLTALTNLQSLTLCGLQGHGSVPGSVEVLAGLPTTHLTHLCLSVETATVPLIHQLTRFLGLQDLSLFGLQLRLLGIP